MAGVIYEPKGTAKEYGELALNLYTGCSHGCVYCYVPNVLCMKRDKFNNEVKPKKDIIERLEKQLISLDKKDVERKHVFMSFTCDPYQPIEEELKLTREAIKLLNKYEFPVNILTKAGELAQRDFDLLCQNQDNKFGVTMHLWNQDQSKEWEPNAALPVERLDNLNEAKKLGLYTWMSIEPIIDVEQALNLIDSTQNITDFYGIGKLNYHKHSSTINWSETLEEFEDRLKQYNKEHIIHKSMLDCKTSKAA